MNSFVITVDMPLSEIITEETTGIVSPRKGAKKQFVSAENVSTEAMPDLSRESGFVMMPRLCDKAGQGEVFSLETVGVRPTIEEASKPKAAAPDNTVRCPKCEGTGEFRFTFGSRAGEVARCTVCDGHGKTTKSRAARHEDFIARRRAKLSYSSDE